jgi:hypothetical protein
LEIIPSKPNQIYSKPLDNPGLQMRCFIHLGGVMAPILFANEKPISKILGADYVFTTLKA